MPAIVPTSTLYSLNSRGGGSKANITAGLAPCAPTCTQNTHTHTLTLTHKHPKPVVEVEKG